VTAPVAHALVLTAGLGTRLRPLTLVRAKPAIPLAGTPMIRRTVGALVAAGVTDITCNLHYLPHSLTAVLGDGADLGARVRYSWELPTILGSAGGPRRALDIIGADTFFLLNGDTLTDASLPHIARAHQESGALVTMALVPNTEPEKYGGIVLDSKGCMIGSVKAVPGAAGSYNFIGVQVAHRDVFAPLSPTQPSASVGEVYDRLIAERPGSIRGVVVDARFWDIGTVADYWRTSFALAEPGDVIRGERTTIDARASVRDSILWDDVRVEHGAILDRCIVTDGVYIAPGTIYRQSIVRREGEGVSATPLSGALAEGR
jgi:NDP-sugar pyrophosphorylase family protein